MPSLVSALSALIVISFAFSAAADGSVAAWPTFFDLEYLCPAEIGGQPLWLQFDTGSADLWAFSSVTPAALSQGHNLYNPALSNTAQELTGYTWAITYGDGGAASGNLVYTDTVNIGGFSVPSQAVELPQQVTNDFVYNQLDGILGLAFSSINTVQPQRQNTFFQTAINQGLLTESVFTVDLKAGVAGSYDFGFIDPAKYNGDITYVPVDDSAGLWQIVSAGYAVGSGPFQYIDFVATADTGSYPLLLDDDIVNAYYAAVPNAAYSPNGGFYFPCSATLPDLTLIIGEYDAVIPGHYLNAFPTSTQGLCAGALQSNNNVGGVSLFGNVFLKSQFVVFDSGNMQLGFAAKNL